jgi:hypothetical protein
MLADGKKENSYLIKPEGYRNTKRHKLELINHPHFKRVNGRSHEKSNALPEYNEIRAIAQAYGYPLLTAKFNVR